MPIQNLESLIRAREKQMGKKMIEDDIPDKNEEKKPESSEVLEIVGLIFEYSKQKFSELSSDINIIKTQQKKILEILEKYEDKEQT